MKSIFRVSLWPVSALCLCISDRASCSLIAISQSYYSLVDISFFFFTPCSSLQGSLPLLRFSCLIQLPAIVKSNSLLHLHSATLYFLLLLSTLQKKRGKYHVCFCCSATEIIMGYILLITYFRAMLSFGSLWYSPFPIISPTVFITTFPRFFLVQFGIIVKRTGL